MPRVRAWLHALLFLSMLSQPACRPSRPAAHDGCSPGIEAPRDLAVPGATLILGELHGTREVPMFAADLACLLLARGHKVVLALEIPATEQERIDRFLARRAAKSGDRRAAGEGAAVGAREGTDRGRRVRRRGTTCGEGRRDGRAVGRALRVTTRPLATATPAISLMLTKSSIQLACSPSRRSNHRRKNPLTVR